jgi:hypothetical protein
MKEKTMNFKLAIAAVGGLMTIAAGMPETAMARQYTRYYHGHTYYHHGYRHCRGGNGAVGTVAGGVGGALIGNAVGGGALGTIGGGVGGALLGRHLDKANSRHRRGC